MRTGILVLVRMGAATPAAHGVDVGAVQDAQLTVAGLFDFGTQQIPCDETPRFIEAMSGWSRKSRSVSSVGCTSTSRVTPAPATGAGTSRHSDWWSGQRPRRTVWSQPLVEPISKPSEEN